MSPLLAGVAIATATPGYLEAPHPLRTTTCYGAAIIEAKTGKLLWGRDVNTPRYPASTTKILTTLLLLENTKPEDVIVAPPEIKTIREASMHLEPGEGVRAKFMAYALMLRSANDGCYAVAKHVGGSATEFANMLNARASQIGCKNTHFVTPNGLHDKNHYTTPLDLCLIAREAMKRPDFQEIARTRTKVIDRSKNFGDRLMKSKNKFLWDDPTADGIKTGYTNPAGHTYVGSATREGMRLIDSIMFAPKWKDDHKRMLDWAFSEYRLELVQPKGPIDTSNSDLKCPAEIRQDAYACIHKSGDLVEVKFELGTGSRPFKSGDQVGQLVITDKDKFVQRIPAYASGDEPMTISTAVGFNIKPNFFAIASLGGVIGAGTIAALKLRKRFPAT